MSRTQSSRYGCFRDRSTCLCQQLAALESNKLAEFRIFENRIVVSKTPRRSSALEMGPKKLHPGSARLRRGNFPCPDHFVQSTLAVSHQRPSILKTSHGGAKCFRRPPSRSSWQLILHLHIEQIHFPDSHFEFARVSLSSTEKKDPKSLWVLRFFSTSLAFLQAVVVGTLPMS